MVERPSWSGDDSSERDWVSFVEGSEGGHRRFGVGQPKLEGTLISGVEAVSRSLGGGSSELRTFGVGAWRLRLGCFGGANHHPLSIPFWAEMAQNRSVLRKSTKQGGEAAQISASVGSAGVLALPDRQPRRGTEL